MATNSSSSIPIFNWIIVISALLLILNASSAISSSLSSFSAPTFQQPCNPSPCQNGGVCSIKYSASSINGTPIGFQCSCPLGWQGSLCEIRVPSVCDDSPCSNGGQCALTHSLTTYRCNCRRGWRGPTCDEIDYCSKYNNPCKNGATCHSTADGFKCICDQGFTGK